MGIYYYLPGNSVRHMAVWQSTGTHLAERNAY